MSIPESHQDLLEKPIVVSFATIMPNGQPQVQCVWCAYENGYLHMFTVKGTQKEKNMLRQPWATILAVDPQNPFRYLEVRGIVEEMTDDGAEALADKLTQSYMNAPSYFGYVVPAEQKGKAALVRCKIKPTKVVTVG